MLGPCAAEGKVDAVMSFAALDHKLLLLDSWRDWHVGAIPQGLEWFSDMLLSCWHRAVPSGCSVTEQLPPLVSSVLLLLRRLRAHYRDRMPNFVDKSQTSQRISREFNF